MLIALIIISIVALAIAGLYLKARLDIGRNSKAWNNTKKKLQSDVDTLTARLDEANKKAESASKNAESASQNAESIRRSLSAKDQEVIKLKSSLENYKMRRIDAMQTLMALQRTMYTDPGHIKVLFSDFFLLHRPFEMAGGDFYKFISMGDFTLVACGNCGISGETGLLKGIQNVAMLEEIVQRNGLANMQAGEVLDALRTKYAHIAERDGYRRDADEDVPVNFTVCIVNQRQRSLSYAGAYGSLCLIRKAYPGTNRREVDVHEFRGDKMNFAVSFGRRKNYTTENIVLEKDDKIYLKTDGYVNQRGGSSNARYGDQYLRQLLMKLANEPMLEQRKALEQEFDNWRGNNRGNDILVIGLALKITGK